MEGADLIQRTLARLAGTAGAGASDELPSDWRETAERLSDGPDPAGAWQRAAALPRPWLAGPLSEATTRLLHEGPYPARLMGLLPHGRDLLADRATYPLELPSLSSRIAAAVDRDGLSTGIGRVRCETYLHLARREVEGAPLEETGAGLSALAEATIDAALPAGAHDVVTVMGMGKLGGNELNFLSDVDLILVHADSVKTSDVVPMLRTLVQRLEGEAPWRPVFKVDLRLRPFGRRGPLAMSAGATEAYYERHGRPWERQAWLRARPVGGDRDLGHGLVETLTPFVYRRNVDPRIFDEVSTLMLRARREARAPLGGDAAVDVKLDAGGIREVEFFAQALQLLHGGRRPELRTRPTLAALDRLLAGGLVSDREHAQLTEAYRWLRHVEHRIQLGAGRQTHTIPSDPEERATLARRIGERFEADLIAHRTAVSTIAQTLHGPSDDEDVERAERQRRAARQAILDPAAPVDVQVAALSHLGVRGPEDAQALLAHLYARPDGVFSASGAARAGAEALLLDCLDAADPDMALRRLSDFAAHRPAHFAIWRFLADPGSAERRRLCAELFGSSEPLSHGLIAFPHGTSGEQDESMALLGTSPGLPTPEEIEAAFETPDPRGVLPTVLRHKQRLLVQIGLHDLGHRPDPLDVGRSLSDLADEVVRRLTRDLLSDARGFRLAVLALGKLGMQSMDYGSDLDLMFVYAGEEGPEIRSAATRTAQNLIRHLEDRSYGARLYEVDMRLRPSGRTGLLVSSLEGFRRYHAADLPTWERLALLRVRPVVTAGEGPADLTDIIENQILPSTLFGRDADPGTVAADVRDLKRRIERELARESRGTFHVKAGRGGTLELELLVGALQLIHGRNLPSVRVRGVVGALHALGRAGIVGSADVENLSASYGFLRRMLNRLRMGHAPGLRDPERFSLESPRLHALARRMGLAGDADLVRAFREHRGAVRGAFVRLLPASPEHGDQVQ